MIRFIFLRSTFIRRALYKQFTEQYIFTATLALFFIIFVFYVSFSSNSKDGVYNESDRLVDKYVSETEEQPNKTWTKLRRELLNSNSTISKVVVFSYMRGGTTLFSDMFNIDPSSSVLWHEPMDAFYQSYAGFEAHSIPASLLFDKNMTRRLKDDFEQKEIADYLENLLRCRPEGLPIETFAHFHLSYSSAFNEVYRCIESKGAKSLLFNCAYPLRSICGHVDLIRRDMSKTFENQCIQTIALLKSLLPKELYLVRNPTIAMTKTGSVNKNLRSLYLKRLYDITYQKFKTIVSRHFGQLPNKMKHNIDIFTDRQLCIANAKLALDECLPPAFQVCQSTKLSALKLIRVMFDDLEEVIRRVPDVHVIHYVRDPRAIAVSRSNPETHLTMHLHDRSAVTEAKVVCQKMREDLKAKKRLNRKYPGSVITIRYEDFVRNPLRQVTDVFEYIGRPVPSDIGQWIHSRFNGTTDNGIYGTIRMDSVQTSVQWMSEVKLIDAIEMDRYCHDVLSELGYTTFHSKTSDTN